MDILVVEKQPIGGRREIGAEEDRDLIISSPSQKT